MTNPEIALIGNGYLGQAYERMFPNAVVYDEPKHLLKANGERIDDKRWNAGLEGLDDFKQVGRAAVNMCEMAIVAVPTDYKEDGTLDTSIVEEIVGWLDTDIILIKSALQPGTTDRLVEETGKNIAVSVEFIGEGTYYQPSHKYPHPTNPKEHQLLIVGGEEPTRSRAAEILWQQMSPDIRIHLVTAKEAEITKMAENTYGALKVTWSNVLRDICDKYGANFIQVHQAWSEDGRVDPMHTRSISSKRGWDSKCYNKDVRAFANLSDSMMLKGLVEDNERHLGLNAKDKT